MYMLTKAVRRTLESYSGAGAHRWGILELDLKAQVVWVKIKVHLAWVANRVNTPQLNNIVTAGRFQIHQEFKYEEIHLILNQYTRHNLSFL